MTTIAIAQCACGAAPVELLTRPLMRAICHCTICQEFNQAPYGDALFFRAKDVRMPAADAVTFTSYSASGVVQRGRCAACDQAAVETATLPPFGKIVGVPTANVTTMADFPEPALHIFYHRRQADVEDDLPKYSGFWPSQLAFGRAFLYHRLRQAWA